MTPPMRARTPDRAPRRASSDQAPRTAPRRLPPSAPRLPVPLARVRPGISGPRGGAVGPLRHHHEHDRSRRRALDRAVRGVQGAGLLEEGLAHTDDPLGLVVHGKRATCPPAHAPAPVHCACAPAHRPRGDADRAAARRRRLAGRSTCDAPPHPHGAPPTVPAPSLRERVPSRRRWSLSAPP